MTLIASALGFLQRPLGSCERILILALSRRSAEHADLLSALLFGPWVVGIVCDLVNLKHVQSPKPAHRLEGVIRWHTKALVGCSTSLAVLSRVTVAAGCLALRRIDTMAPEQIRNRRSRDPMLKRQGELRLACEKANTNAPLLLVG